MASPIAVLFADSHLAERAWMHRPGIAGDSYYSLGQIVDFAVDKGVHTVIGAGDLIDKQVNRAEPIVRFTEQIARLEEAGVHFAYTQGQHEMQLGDPWLATHPWAQHIHKKRYTIGEHCHIYGLDFLPAGQFQQAAEEIPQSTFLLIGHQVVGDFMGSVAAPQCVCSDIPVVSAAFFGDNHGTTGLFKKKGKDGQALTFISPGSTCMQDIAEPPDKFFWVLCDDMSFKKVRLKTRRMLDWPNLLVPSQVDDFVTEIAAKLEELWDATLGWEKGIRTPLLRVTYSHKLIEHRQRIRKAVGDRAHVFWKEIPPEPTEAVARRLAAKKASGQRRAATLASELAAYLEGANLSALADPARRLIDAASPADELQRLRAEALA